MGNKISTTGFWWEKLEGKTFLGIPRRRWGIILKCILKKLEGHRPDSSGLRKGQMKDSAPKS